MLNLFQYLSDQILKPVQDDGFFVIYKKSMNNYNRINDKER
jgi:hypothetical protein